MNNTTEAASIGQNPIAEILEALMYKHSLSQTDLAQRSGVSQPAINRILKERSKVKKPRQETLEKIGGVLGVTPEQLTGQAPISVRLFDKGAVPIGYWETLVGKPLPSNITPSKALICPVPHSDMSFALPVIGEAMVGDNGYREGDVIFVDPIVKPTHGRDVVVVNSQGGLLRRYAETPEGQFLIALNPNWPTPILPLTSDIIVMGTVIFSGRIR